MMAGKGFECEICNLFHFFLRIMNLLFLEKYLLKRTNRREIEKYFPLYPTHPFKLYNIMILQCKLK